MAPTADPTICVHTSLSMAHITASVQLKALAAPEGTGGAYQYVIIFGPSHEARMPKRSAQKRAKMAVRFMRPR